jgi:hypothetical protein
MRALIEFEKDDLISLASGAVLIFLILEIARYFKLKLKHYDNQAILRSTLAQTDLQRSLAVHQDQLARFARMPPPPPPPENVASAAARGGA